MPVYIDNMFQSPLGRFGRLEMSHMIADTSDELHAVAAKLGIKREWCQDEGTTREHYDVAKRRRANAIAYYNVHPITMRELARVVRERTRCAAAGEPCPMIAELLDAMDAEEADTP